MYITCIYDRCGWMVFTCENVDTYRPTIRLRSREKVKFKSNKRNLEKILKSPLYRGIKLWDMIPESIQRSLTKVKLKRLIKGLHL